MFRTFIIIISLLLWTGAAKSEDFSTNQSDCSETWGCIGRVVTYIRFPEKLDWECKKFNYVSCNPDRLNCYSSCSVGGAPNDPMEAIRKLKDKINEIIEYLEKTK